MLNVAVIEPPARYWRRMRPQNLAGPAPLGILREPPALNAHDFAAAMSERTFVVDARSPEVFAGGHVPGAPNVPLGSSFSTWAGTVLPEGAEILLVIDDPNDLWDATGQLLPIGYDPGPDGWPEG